MCSSVALSTLCSYDHNLFPELSKKRVFFLKQFQVHNKLQRKVQRFLIHPLPPHVHSLLHYQHPHPEGAFVVIDEPTLTHHNIQSPQFTLGLPLMWYNSMGADKCSIVACIHYNITWYFHCPKIPLCSTCSSCPIPSHSTQVPGNCWSFYCLLSFALLQNFSSPQCPF